MLSLKPTCSSATKVDSADAGKKEALSFFCTSLSLPARGPTKPLMASQAIATSTAIQTARRPVLGFLGVGVNVSIEAMPVCCRIGADEASRLPAPDIVNPRFLWK